MSATPQTVHSPSTRLSLAGRWVAYDPQDEGWLVLEQAAVIGAVPWLVTGRHTHRAEAERAAGFHASPIVRWMLHDADLGWLRRGGKAWMHTPCFVTQFSQQEAAAIASAQPTLQLLVVRASGLVTCPDLPGEAP